MNRIHAILAKVQEALELKHWRIYAKYVDDAELGNALMQVKINRKRNAATVFYRESLSSLSTEEITRLFTHELLHVHLDLMCREHYREVKYTRNEHFNDEMERVVENLAHVISKLLK